MKIDYDSSLCEIYEYPSGITLFSCYRHHTAFLALMEIILSKSQFKKFVTGNDIRFIISKKSEQFLKGDGIIEFKKKWQINNNTIKTNL